MSSPIPSERLLAVVHKLSQEDVLIKTADPALQVQVLGLASENAILKDELKRAKEAVGKSKMSGKAKALILGSLLTTGGVGYYLGSKRKK